MNSVQVISDSNLSVAWSKAFSILMNPGATHLSPLVVKVSGFAEDTVPEDGDIRQALDASLRAVNLQSTQTVANTIFPQSMWNPDASAELLFERFRKNWPRIRTDPLNRYGHYFQRLIEYENGNEPVNQLGHIISTWKLQNHRHSALQASIFDPRRDHTNSRRRGFPCLQQVAFSPIGQNGIGGFAVIGFYGTQHLFEKAYGNYLGLFRLGRFMAREMGLVLTQMICVASYASLGNVSRLAMTDLNTYVKARVEQLEKRITNEQ